ncbi:enoyl-CoA hydratase/isomerase family protein [Pseudonocardia sp. WMMC193]|uniref:enoyl-CoA hydratase/isomerase family protein n=1 Tax=Pseudonocardia sp. WMMC193 TaxID=2911965 RepID=UPI001F0052CA|nr:enoyl-CoA hydratase-related protein [Pseudonocardia sp. WMMC193]MCF7550773.1 enoyl-CoA hydratase-related protein [Pseudonocardia sp. WMMC193]
MSGSTPAAPAVVVEREGRLGVVRLNRPTKLNSLDAEAIQGVRDGFAAHGADDAVTAVLLEGEGRSFCAGGDQSSGSQGAGRPDGAYGWYCYLAREANSLVRQLVGFDKPVVAAVQGHVYGAGMSLAMMADVVVAAADVRFSTAYLRIANKPDFGATYLLPRRVPSLSVAKDLLFTCRVVEADEALRLGLANRVVDPGRLRAEARALAGELADGPPQSLRITKQILDRSLDCDLETVLAMEALGHGIVKVSKDHAEGVAAFFAKRAPTFTGE